MLILICFRVSAQTIVSSINELLPYLDDNNANVKLTPGIYRITAADVKAGKYPLQTVFKDGAILKAIFLFAGNNSTYDFTGVTVYVETAVFQAYGNFEVYEAHVTGNNNLVKNLTLIDDGSENDYPTGGAVNLVMDGSDNTYEGIHVYSTGSKPYGYGDAFGKGGTNNIIGHKKHSTFLIRGLRNHALNDTLIHRTYGHCIFMQAASYPTVEGCYVEGEMRSTDDMLAEKGTGSAADNVDFMTTWGYTLPAGYMMALGEEGIRAYNGGTTIIDGEIIERGTDNPTVLNCTVKNMRGGVTLAHATGTRYVEGCTVIGCEQAFAIGTGTVTKCFADAAYGPVYRSTYASDNGVKVDITILPAKEYYNGMKALAYLGGKNHNITFTTTDPNINSNLKIFMGGYVDGIRVKNGANASQNNHTATGITLNNHTGYEIEIPAVGSNNTISTCGVVIDDGSGNTVNYYSDCEIVSTCGDFDAFATIQGEAFCETRGGAIAGGGTCVGSLFNGDWVKYDAVNFDQLTADGFEIVLAKAHEGKTYIDVYLDEIAGNSIATIEVPYTPSGWYDWATLMVEIDEINGIHDVFLAFRNDDPSTGVVNIESFKFVENIRCVLGQDAFSIIEAEDYCEMDGIQTEASTENGDNIGYIENGDWVKYSHVNFGDKTAKSIEIRVACKFTGGDIEIREGSETGNLLGTLVVTNTGGNQNWVSVRSNITQITGKKDIYLVFKGGNGYLFNVNHLMFLEESMIITSDSEASSQNLSVYPNPVISEMYIYNVGGNLFELLSYKGDLELSGEIKGDFYSLEMSHLSAGIYFLKVYNSVGIQVQKVIKK